MAGRKIYMPRKRFLSVIAAGIACGIGLYVLGQKDDTEKKDILREYLEEKYGKKFEVHKKLKVGDIKGEDAHYAYSANPIDNKDIVFEVGVRLEKTHHALTPPTEMEVYYDTYFDAAVEYVANKIKVEHVLDVNSVEQMEDAIESITASIHVLGLAISEMGFSTEEYTPKMYFVLLSNKVIHNETASSMLQVVSFPSTAKEEDVRKKLVAFLLESDSKC